MTNLQLLLSIGIPSLLIVLGWLHQNQRITDLRGDMQQQFMHADKRTDRVEARLDRMDAHLARIDEDLRQFYGTDKQLEGRINELSARIK